MYGYEMRNTSYSFNSSIKNINYDSHLHKEIELLYVNEGSLTIQSNFIQYNIEKGDMYISFPNTVHECESNGETTCMLWIFNSEMIKDFSSEIKRNIPTSPIIRRDALHSDVLYSIEAFITRKNLTIDSHLCRSFLSLIMSHVLSTLEFTTISNTTDTDWMLGLLLFLNDNYTDKLTLNIIASKVGVSRYYLSRTFSAKMGCSIPDYINKLRISNAIELIKHTDETISEIAYKCGFESMPTFFRSFRKNGLPSPNSFRITKDKSNI